MTTRTGHTSGCACSECEVLDLRAELDEANARICELEAGYEALGIERDVLSDALMDSRARIAELEGGDPCPHVCDICEVDRDEAMRGDQ